MLWKTGPHPDWLALKVPLSTLDLEDRISRSAVIAGQSNKVARTVWNGSFAMHAYRVGVKTCTAKHLAGEKIFPSVSANHFAAGTATMGLVLIDNARSSSCWAER